MIELTIEEGERLDRIGFDDLRLIQKPADFCYGVDAVILAHFASTGGEEQTKKRLKAKRGIDLGTGTGIIPIILSYKTDIDKIFGLEIQTDSFHRAIRNMKLNGLEEKTEIWQGDVSNIEDAINSDLLGTFDLVTANPPYVESNSGIKNDNNEKMIARHETTGRLSDFVRAASLLLKPKASFFMIHRPSRLVDIFACCRANNLEPKGIRFVAPRQGEAANILLLHCVKEGKPQLKVMDNLYVYEGDGYTKEINEIYER